MPEYIDRNEAIKKIRDVYEFKYPMVSGAKIATELVSGVLKDLPTADVVEVKHGYWKPKHYEGGFMDGTNFEECSICRYRRYFDDIRFKLTFDYCPKCGAKMDLKEGAKSDL